jgi:hypothetical protein
MTRQSAFATLDPVPNSTSASGQRKPCSQATFYW